MHLDHTASNYLHCCQRTASNVLRRAPRRTQCHGRRAFHLVHNLFAAGKDKESVKQLSTVKIKTYPQADDVLLTLIEGESEQGTTMTLLQALQRVKPLSYLTEAGEGAYRILTFPDPGPVHPIKGQEKSYKPFTRAGRGKEVHLTTSWTPEHLRDSLRLSYEFLLQGARMEFHLHQKSAKSRKKGDHTVDWALAHCLHLRPDSILAAMPEGTTMLAHPATTNMSFKKRPPHNFSEATSQVMWAMEYQKALESVGARTPERIKKRGQWQGESVDYKASDASAVPV